jgi:hypothetical protein
MKYKFEKVIDGLSRYIDAEIIPSMNDLQEFFARVLLGRFLSNEEYVKEIILSNGFLKTFGIIDSEGMVDVHTLVTDIRRELCKKEKITLDIPMFGKMTFVPSDVDVLYHTITGEEYRANAVN